MMMPFYTFADGNYIKLADLDAWLLTLLAEGHADASQLRLLIAMRSDVAALLAPEKEEKGPGKLSDDVSKAIAEGAPVRQEMGPAIGHVGGLKRANFD